MLRASLCVIVMACSGASAPGADPDAQDTVARNGASYAPDTAWRTARASQVGLDSARLAALSQRLQSGAIPDISSLIIVREGYVVVERYFNGSSRDDVHTMQSVSKSVTSLVAGIAADQGKLDPQSLIFDVLQGYDDLAVSDPRKRPISLRHLLEMRAGINFHESPYAGSP